MKWTLAMVVAISAGCQDTSGSTDVTCQALTVTGPARLQDFPGTVFTVVMENKSRSDIVGNHSAPYINELIGKNALAAGYRDSYVHPSEPNYLWMVAGENFGVLDDADPVSHPIDSTSHIADQLELAGLTWKAYQQGMGAACGLTSHGRYAAKHDPFVYFDDINGWDGHAFQPSQRCDDHVVDYSQLDQDLAQGSVPDYVFITPDLDHDMHDGSIATGDQWLSTELPKIFASPSFQNGGVLFLLWDEGSGTLGPGDDPPFIAISPAAKPGYVSRASYDTSSYLMTIQKMLGLDQLPCSSRRTSVHTMDDLFATPLGL